jgi:KUP system potassium uptake protein
MATTNGTKNLPALLIATVGVVFGDIGTSPLYALKETFAGHHGMPVVAENVFGILSLVVWSIVLLVSVKYVALIMRADNRGEGGSLSLLALVRELTAGRRTERLVVLLGIAAAALFYGDSMITPAISVLSAVEGLKVGTAAFEPYVVPIALVVLAALFAIQRYGTGAVGQYFGPIMCFWFTVLALLGIYNIASAPDVLMALSPHYAVNFFLAHPLMGFYALGTVVLAITGGEALYTDMGHFGRRPIRLSWFGFVMPALVLNYFGQGALLLVRPEAIENPFYLLAPDWALYPMIALSTMATVIASQAVISGAFSVARQAVQMGLLPRMNIVHTSGDASGQIYVPFTNFTLFIAVAGLVLFFQNSSNLAAAYGIAVTGTMMIDTILIAFVMALLWRWNILLVLLIGGAFLFVDLAFFAANLIKVADGGWFPIVIGAASFVVLTTWRKGRELVRREQAKLAVSIDVVMLTTSKSVFRAKGTAVFLTAQTEGVPAALLHNLKHNQVVHERVIFLTVITGDVPRVPAAERVTLTGVGPGFYRLIVKYGFMQTPNVPLALRFCDPLGLEFDPGKTSYFLSREKIVPKIGSGMWLWREELFSLMVQNALPATTFFNIPPDRVVELGSQLEI